MDDMNFKNQNETQEKKPNTFWKVLGISVLSFALAVLTIIVINS